MSLQEIQNDLAALREEPIAEDEFAVIRNAVLREIRSRRNFGWGWLAAAAAILIAASSLLLIPRRRTTVPMTVSVLHSITNRTETPVPVIRAAHVRHRHRAVRPRPEAAPPLTVKFVTDDPGVVIIWQFEKLGE